jgi:DNA invertase Pin-like site-specific DNA recombinase
MRMSTEHQQYSIANQAAAIQEYATTNSIEIVRTYVDRGKSGLSLAGRQGLKDLLQTVQSGAADFNFLLVYDVSRFGRFQDVDEGAYYEHVLKKAGVTMIYCAEPFRDNGSPTDALLKALKRAMAAEYSRELSAKVGEGMRRIAALGFKLGGSAGFGLRRVAFDPSGSRRTVLANGEHKAIHTDRVTLIHGPAEEVGVVREVFDLFINHDLSEARIAAQLNKRGIVTGRGNPWQKKAIRDMLANPKYTGDMLYNRTTARLLAPLVRNPRDKWVCVADCFAPIVSREVFDRAQAIYRRRADGADSEDMLARLRALLAKHGNLSTRLINSEPDMYRAATYGRRFGSLVEAYRRVGWCAKRCYRQSGIRPRFRALQQELEQAITSKLAETADSFNRDAGAPHWLVNGDLSIHAAVIRSHKTDHGRREWTFYGNKKRSADIVVMARMTPGAERIMDYFVFPGHASISIRVYEENPPGRSNSTDFRI